MTEHTQAEHVEVAIVGAGFAGIGMALALRRAGRTSLRILERGDAVGGTWRDNTYPGVACDVPSHLYGFAAHPNPDWSGVYATGAEIHEYLGTIVARERLHPQLRLQCPLLHAQWCTDRWLLSTGSGPLTADVLVLACGRLTEPSIPAIAGLETFAGPMFHSSRWDHRVPLAGRRVAVVGTGASAVQLVPELARTAGQVTVFQRSPAWIVPREHRSYTAAERAHFAQDVSALARLRTQLYRAGEARFASRSGDKTAARQARQIARDHLHGQVSDPALRAALTPDYEFGCKRVLLSDEFYPALSSERVTLEPSALAAVRPDALIAESGAQHSADVLVLATGFAASQQPYAELVVGEQQHSLAEAWSAGMAAFASTAVAGFPNMFVLNGPNASLGHNSSVLMLEEQADYVLRSLARRRSIPILRVDPAAQAEYVAEVDHAAAETPWLTGGCRNWYVDPRSGRLTLLWPGTVDAFRRRLAAANGSEYLPTPQPIPATSAKELP